MASQFNEQSQNEGRASWPEITALLRPYTGQMLLLAAVAFGLGLLTSSSQVALTPLLEIILNGGQLELPPAGQPLNLDLNDLGGALLGAASRLTGIQDGWTLLVITSLLYLALALGGQAAGYAGRYYAEQMRTSITRDLSSKLYGHLLHLPLSVISRHHTGWLQARMTNDISTSMTTVSQMLIDGLSAVLLTLFYGVLLISTDLRLTIVAGVAGMLHLLLSNYLAGRFKDAVTADQEIFAASSGLIQERLVAVREVKALRAQDFEQRSMFDVLTRRYQAAFRRNMLQFGERVSRWSINRTVIIGVMLFGAWLLLRGEITTVGFGLFMFFAQSLIGPLSTLAGIITQAASIDAGLSNVLYLLRQPAEGGGQGLPAPRGLEQAITFEDVGFAYQGDLPVLQGINLTLNKGEMIALVGRSGAGKSTLADLLLRFYEPTEGRLLLDGVPVQQLDLNAYRGLFGVVSQDCALLDASVYENIAYARPHLTQADVETAARIANAEGFIQSDLPDGYNTLIGERGVRLSGGQRQRIAIARAVVHRPAILVLDEATSALDSESERLVQAAIDEVVKGCTAVVIAHRLSTIRRADKIVVLEGGRIIEMGTHDALLALGGEYYNLYTQQFNAGLPQPMP